MIYCGQSDWNLKEDDPNFVVLTALHQYWPEFGKVIFLGPWCGLFSDREMWQPRVVTTIPAWHESGANLCSDIKKLRVENFDPLLECLTEHLNLFHNVNYSRKYWLIILGPWLISFVDVLWDRYKTLEYARRLYPGFITYGVAREPHITPRDTIDFLEQAQTDLFNQRLFTEILELLGHEGIVMQEEELALVGKQCPGSKEPRVSRASHSLLGLGSKMSRAKQWVRYHLFRTLLKLQKEPVIILQANYFRFWQALFLAFCKGKTVPYWRNPKFDFKPQPTIALDTRERLKSIRNFDSTEFERIITELIPKYMPTAFLEDYGRVKKEGERVFPKSVRAIIAELYYDEPLKTWAASQKEKGALLIGLQHGGANFIHRANRSESHELEIRDQFLSWGTQTADRKKIRKISSPKLASIQMSRLKTSNATILLSPKAFPRYNVRLSSGVEMASYIETYIENQFRFVTSLTEDNRRVVVVRPFPHDFGWGYRERWAERFPDVSIRTRGRFAEVINEAGICVSDCISTTWIETLFANVPTILYWDPDVEILDARVEKVFNLLRRVRILHDTPESAGRMINSINSRVSDWWQTESVQAARVSTLGKYGYVSGRPNEEWRQYLRSLA